MRRSLLGSGKYTFTITADQSSTITIGGGLSREPSTRQILKKEKTFRGL